MYEYKAKILSVYDADGSFNAEIDLGMGIKIERKIRLYGVDTPEMRGEQKYAGRVARDYVRGLILDKEVIITTQRDETGKYGRLLAYIQIDGNKELGAELIIKGYAKAYLGGTKEGWTEAELDKIVKSKK